MVTDEELVKAVKDSREELARINARIAVTLKKLKSDTALYSELVLAIGDLNYVARNAGACRGALEMRRGVFNLVNY